MTIRLNGKEEETNARTIAALVKSNIESDEGIVVLINDQVLNREKWFLTEINENDQVEFLRFVGGG